MTTVEQPPEISVILPCLDEEESIAASIEEAFTGLRRSGHSGEILVVDNGSSDHSVSRAVDAGARVIVESTAGYGAALRAGIDNASGCIGVMADADLTYDLANLGDLVSLVEAGNDLAMASRLDGMNRGTMPLLHRLLGTPVLSFILRRVTGGRVAVRDSQSGYRAFDLARIRSLQLQTNGMEFASEMLLRAGESDYSIEEIRLPYRPRTGESKLNPFEDGLRHLKLLALLAPKLALLWPGALLAVIGTALTVASLAQPDGIEIGNSRWQPVFFGPIALVMASLLIVGYVVLSTASPLRSSHDSAHRRLRRRLAWSGLASFAAGTAVNGVLFGRWASGGEPWARSMALAGLAQALMLSGAVWIASAFLYWLMQGQSEYGSKRQESSSSDGGEAWVDQMVRSSESATHDANRSSN